MKEKAAPILKHFIDPEIVKVIVNIWELMTALTKDIDGQPGTSIVKERTFVIDIVVGEEREKNTTFRDALCAVVNGILDKDDVKRRSPTHDQEHFGIDDHWEGSTIVQYFRCNPPMPWFS